MDKSKRIYFTFPEKALEQLEHVMELGRFKTMADAVGNALAIEEALQEEAQKGNERDYFTQSCYGEGTCACYA